MNEERIIGDFLEIVGDILYQKMNSKLPKFITNIISKIQYRRLIKSVYKLKKSKYILSKDNLLELFACIYNNFPPSGKYNSIKGVKAYENSLDKITAIVEFEGIRVIFSIEKEETNFKASIVDNNIDGNMYSYELSLPNLISANKKYKEIIMYINNELLNNVCDYIVDIINKYYKGE